LPLPLSALLFVIPQRSGGICGLLLLLLFSCHPSLKAEDLLLLLLLVCLRCCFWFVFALAFAVVCPFVCHSAAQRRNLRFAFAF
jgi:hypothetical protein